MLVVLKISIAASTSYHVRILFKAARIASEFYANISIEKALLLKHIHLYLVILPLLQVIEHYSI
jgi:hypothetical protein